MKQTDCGKEQRVDGLIPTQQVTDIQPWLRRVQLSKLFQ